MEKPQRNCHAPLCLPRRGFNLCSARVRVLCIALMLFLFRKDRFHRTARVAAAALLLLSTSRSLAEGSSSEAIVVVDAGQPRRFEIARDELHFKDRTGAARVQRLP